LSVTQGDGEVLEGCLACVSCHREYAIHAGIPHFIQPQELTGLNQRFARLYDHFAPVYGPSVRVALTVLVGSERRARMHLLERLELKGGRLLEVSVGPGSNLPYLFESRQVTEVYGLDISLGQLRRCRSLVRKHGWPVELALGMAEALPYADESFDSIFHFGGINFFSDKQRAIEEMIRVAKPGTRVVISDETEQAARWYERIPGFSREEGGQLVAMSAPVNLVPQEMQEVAVREIWRRFGHAHGYVLEFRKPGG